MPHFVIDCTEKITEIQKSELLLMTIHSVAVESGLFNESDIKVRLNPYDKDYLVGGKQDDFIHVFAHVMQGRTTEQKAHLSKQIVKKLKELFPSVPFIAMNVVDFEKATYYNKSMI